LARLQATQAENAPHLEINRTFLFIPAQKDGGQSGQMGEMSHQKYIFVHLGDAVRPNLRVIQGRQAWGFRGSGRWL
jgi:hypothetical protein